mmetsp:Transcript_28957/g.72695  ORF Transcript_28957/g.72695 Transcript_28957/m.72695 type:complete len:160 (+) Transcript_28957:127-606(+)
MELVYDNLVTQEKLGTSQYFWSFPSDVAQRKRAKLAELEKETRKFSEYESKQEELLAAAGKKVDVPPSAPEYKAAAEKLEQVKNAHAFLETKVRAEHEDDAMKLKRMVSDMQTIKDGVNRWTDNIAMSKSFYTNKLNMEKGVFDQWLGIRGGSFFESVD